LVAVGFGAAGAITASLRTRVAVALAIGVVGGLVIDFVFWFLLVVHWVGSCTAYISRELKTRRQLDRLSIANMLCEPGGVKG